LRSIEREIGGYERRAQAVERDARAAEHSSGITSQAISSVSNRIKGLESDTRRVDQSGSTLGRFFRNTRAGSDEANQSLSKLNASFQGFQVAFAIKYAQALLTALVGLGTTLFNIASAAAQAGAALAGAFAAGAAQAVPVIGVLVASLTRVASILKLVKEENQNQLLASHNATLANKRQADGINAVRSAQQALADSTRGVARAQVQAAQQQADADRRVREARNNLNLVYRQSKRDVQDLMNAEREAELQARGASLSLEDARRALREAIATGDVASIGQAQLSVDEARNNVRTSRQQVQRTRVDAAPGSQARTQPIVQAQQQLRQAERDRTRQQIQSAQQVADAQRSQRRAQENLTSAQHQNTLGTDQQATAVDRLKAQLALLSPAERKLYDAFLTLQKVYRQNARPITDILVRAYTEAVQRVTSLLQDRRILTGFRNIAQALARQIHLSLNEATGPQSQDFFVFLSKEAVRNIPIVGATLRTLFTAARNFVVAASPAFHDLLLLFRDYAGVIERASTRQQQITDFLRRGVRYFDDFVHLGGAAVRVLAALFRAGSGQVGDSAVQSLTRGLNHLAEQINDNSRKVHKFFVDALDVSKELLTIVGALAIEILGAFSPRNVHSFADFMKQVVIPAVGDAVKAMGFFTTIAHNVLSLPFVSTFAKVFIAAALLTKGFGILHAAVKGLFLLFEANPWIAAISVIIIALIELDKKFHIFAPTLRWLRRAFGDTFQWIANAIGNVVDFILGGISSMLGAIADLIGHLSGLPIVGKKFKGISTDLHDAQDSIDRFRDKVKDGAAHVSDRFDAMGDSASSNADRVSNSMQQMSQRVGKATDASARSFDQLFQAAKVSLKDIRQVTEINMEQIRSTLGSKSEAGKRALSNNFKLAINAVQRQMDAGQVSTKRGMEQIRKYLAQNLELYGFTLRQARNIVATGDPDANKGREGGASQITNYNRATGGPIGRRGEAGRDEVLAMLGRGEVVLTRHQQADIDSGRARTVDDALRNKRPHYFARGGRIPHFASGGRLQLPTNLSAVSPNRWAMAIPPTTSSDGRAPRCCHRSRARSPS
jgi:hypothetical protein